MVIIYNNPLRVTGILATVENPGGGGRGGVSKTQELYILTKSLQRCKC